MPHIESNNDSSGNLERVDLSKGIEGAMRFAERSGGKLTFPVTNPWTIEYLNGKLLGAGKLPEDIAEPLEIGSYLTHERGGHSLAAAEAVLTENEAILVSPGSLSEDHIRLTIFREGEFVSEEISIEEADGRLVGLQALAKQKSFEQIPRQRKPIED